jgi:hypothetical protein
MTALPPDAYADVAAQRKGKRRRYAVRLTAVLDGGATTATPDVKRSDEAHAVNIPNALNLALAARLAGATETFPKAARETIATTLAEAALMLARATCFMLRRAPP